MGQMTWKANNLNSQRILYLRLHPFEKWQPYTAFPQYYQPDNPGVSPGYATFLSLLRQNWQTIPTSFMLD